ncbi:MAG: J domain-containing protein [Alphaproteobacteria bacterium]|nr:J domain-containing protein [Alphaproteobacteria bacterium]
MPRPRTSRIELDSGRTPRGATRACDHPGCRACGEFRAPRGRKQLNDYFWFCLDHVRAYNQAWDYYRGMSEAEIERERRRDTVGQRPSWPMGSRGQGIPAHLRGLGIDPEVLNEALRRLLGDEPPVEPRRSRPRTPEEEALRVLDLYPGASFETIKARYKALAKLHHPDANGGDKAAEERLKSINQAYTLLKSQASGARQASSR